MARNVVVDCPDFHAHARRGKTRQVGLVVGQFG